MASLHENLKAAVTDAAGALALPLGWEGEVFAPPAGPHLRGRIVYEDESAAALGRHAPRRIVGHVSVTAVVMGGEPGADARAVALARGVSAFFARGRGLDCDAAEGAGEAVFGAPQVLTAKTDGARMRAEARMPFIALLFPAS